MTSEQDNSLTEITLLIFPVQSSQLYMQFKFLSPISHFIAIRMDLLLRSIGWIKPVEDLTNTEYNIVLRVKEGAKSLMWEATASGINGLSVLQVDTQLKIIYAIQLANGGLNSGIEEDFTAIYECFMCEGTGKQPGYNPSGLNCSFCNGTGSVLCP